MIKASIIPAALVSVFALSACVQGPGAVSELPAPVAETPPAIETGLLVDVHEGDFATIQQFTTPAGISVWLVNEPSIPIVSLQAAWPGGWSSDPEGLEGLANGMVYQMNEGAGDLEALAYQRRMEELNMSFGCSAGRDWTSCSSSMLRENAEDAMALVALSITQPRFDEGPFERFRRESEVGLAQRETDPGFMAGQALEAALYPDHEYAREMSEDSLAALTREGARAHLDQVMVKDGMLVTAVGAISPEDLAPLVDAAFGDLPDASDLAMPGPVVLGDAVAAPIIDELPQPQSLVRFTSPGLQRDHPDFFTAYVLNYTLGGGGFESRLMKELRIERGLTYGVGTALSFGGQMAVWRGGGQTQNASAGEFITVTRQIMTDMAENGITAEELADAKAYLTGAYPLGFDSNSKIAGNMMGVRQQGLGVDYFDRRNSAVEAVTLEDVNRVAAEYLRPERYTFVVVGQPEGIE